jgi:hypothetical protein
MFGAGAGFGLQKSNANQISDLGGWFGLVGGSFNDRDEYTLLFNDPAPDEVLKTLRIAGYPVIMRVMAEEDSRDFPNLPIP